MIRFKSKIEQAAAHLRDEIARGRWKAEIPGRNELATELGINGKTVESALRLLVREGLLESRGAGRRRRIVRAGQANAPSLRVAILNYEPATRSENHMVDLTYQLRLAGHEPVEPRRTLLDMGMKVERVAKLVEETSAEAWVVVGGSRDILEWFTARRIPVFAMFGRRRQLRIAGAGPDKPPAMRELAQRLVGLGHRRIVLMVRAERRLPEPGATERAFLETLRAHGVEPGSYHIPDWDESADGFEECLDRLFRVTPPTALVLDESPFFIAAMQFLARRGLVIPEQVSIACCDWNPHFSWCKPAITHIGWEIRPVVRRIVRWANHTSLGKEDLKQADTRARLIEGGTIGPVKI